MNEKIHFPIKRVGVVFFPFFMYYFKNLYNVFYPIFFSFYKINGFCISDLLRRKYISFFPWQHSVLKSRQIWLCVGALIKVTTNMTHPSIVSYPFAAAKSWEKDGFLHFFIIIMESTPWKNCGSNHQQITIFRRREIIVGFEAG